MFSERFIYFISLSVWFIARFTTPLSNVMNFIGTGKFRHIQFMWHRTTNDDILSVLTWFIHITSALIFLLVNAPILNFLYQVFLGTVIQHMLWTAFNNHKRIEKPYLFVPFWKLTYWEMWSVITVSLLPMLVSIYLV